MWSTMGVVVLTAGIADYLSLPARVNLIGEHTDCNEGFVLPAAVDKEIVFAVSPRTDRMVRFIASDL
jgi:galactokinase